ncbi:catechol 2,3-dioxygenase-like lactoylglutathione lyase family enzyme [Saccharothrix tamanrassetensis]|uniref:Catechol 2,3-dioxygenase-like lactoylglutathione lyase family enzyme n=1 Tax=Saccharothrix tamanrassetensis TaxID=1051531 RepID=A0A841CTP7_9PSEU|nr:VOC family protein [Saccharothrix tamanrassetensis]MBB5960679.1 catechol 2,3-dioxygenase-like lactoylglutathione lyase family enzyme [Saccharothrix tamanrassetensis]
MATQVQIAVDCDDPARLADFWAAVLGYELEEPPGGFASWPEASRALGGADEQWNAVVDADGVGPRVLFHRVPEPKVAKNRIHLDVRAGGPRGTPKPTRRPLVDAEVGRLVGLGATHVRTVEEADDYFAVMLDPEGNEFCVC